MDPTVKNITYYTDAILRRKWLVIIPTVLLTAIGAYVAYKVPPQYRSTTLILVEKQQVPEAYVTPTDRTPFSEKLNTIRQQIMSRQKLEKIISDFQLYQNTPSFNPLYSALDRFGVKIRRQPLREDVMEKMTNDIDITVIGGRSGDAFSISYSGVDPNTTMQVTNALASFFIEENLKAREQYAEGTSEFLSNELEKAKVELETQEKSVRSFKEKYMGSLPQQLDANLRTLDRLQSELQTVVLEQRNAEDRKVMLESQLNQRAGQTIPGVPSSAPANPLMAELEELQSRLASLQSMYKDTYPDIVIAKKRISDLKEQLAKSKADSENDAKTGDVVEFTPRERNPEIFNNLTVVKSQLAALQNKAADIKKQIKVYEKRVEDTPANEQRFADLRRDYDMSINNYQALLSKKMNARLAENLEKRQKGERFTVINPANLPEKPYNTKKRIILFLALSAAGAALGVGLTVLFEFFTPTFWKLEDLEGTIPLPVLSIIPEFYMKRKERKADLKLVKGKKASGA